MARRKAVRSSNARKLDLSSWNFILFLTLSFILLVVVLYAMNGMTLSLRAKAGLSCPELTLPRAEDCGSGWTYKRDMNGCLAFFCEARPTETNQQLTK